MNIFRRLWIAFFKNLLSFVLPLEVTLLCFNGHHANCSYGVIWCGFICLCYLLIWSFLFCFIDTKQTFELWNTLESKIVLFNSKWVNIMRLTSQQMNVSDMRVTTQQPRILETVSSGKLLSYLCWHYFDKAVDMLFLFNFRIHYELILILEINA